jgi:hypothetical protein
VGERERRRRGKGSAWKGSGGVVEGEVERWRRLGRGGGGVG